MNAAAKLLVLAVLAVMASALPGCGESMAGVGETVKAGPWELVVEESLVLGDFQGKPAASGDVWIVSRALAKNASETTQTLQPAWFKAAKDAEVWTGTTTLKGLAGPQVVPPGRSANVLSAFEVPVDATGIVLLIESPQGTAKVKLN